MKVVMGMIGTSVGYALLYYGVAMIRGYNRTNPKDSKGIPFSALIGVQTGASDVGGDFARPPFSV